MDLSQVIGRGTAANRPAATAVPVGAIYFSTDTLVTERSTGAAWESISDGAVIADGSIVYAKIQNVTDARLLGRSSGSSGPPIEVTVGAGLSLAAGALVATGGNNDWTTVITKSADQDVINSTTLVDDTELQVAVTANDAWHFEILLIYSASDAAKDFKWDVAVSAGTMSGVLQFSGMLTGDTIATTNELSLAEVANCTTGGFGTRAAHGLRMARIAVWAVFSATGIFKFRFAENTLGAGTEARCKAKSKLRGLKVSP